jgi:hypothetical protein
MVTIIKTYYTRESAHCSDFKDDSTHKISNYHGSLCAVWTEELDVCRTRLPARGGTEVSPCADQDTDRARGQLVSCDSCEPACVRGQ